MKKTKILYAASTATHLWRFHMPYIEALRKDADVLLMATGDGVEYPIAFDKHYFSLTNLRNAGKIRKILKRERFDKVILNTTLTAFWVRLAMMGMRRRPFVINVVHGYLFPERGGGIKGKILLFCEKILRRKTDVIVVMNEEDLRIATAHKLCRGKVFFTRGMGLPNVARIPADGELRKQFDASGDRILCTYVGELSGRKNQRFLIEAFQKLIADGVPVSLILVGEGAQRKELEEQITKSGLTGRVFLTGSRNDVPALLAITDIYVSASISEGLPFNAMEAMAYGLPLLMSATKGQTDLLPDRPEMLYPLGDEDAFCRKLRERILCGRLGADAEQYPHLEEYRLSSILEENLKIWNMDETV